MITAASLVLACSPVPPSATPIDPDAHRQGVLGWRQQRMAELLAEDSWLAAVGLFWLESGTQTFGTDPEADLVFAEPPNTAIEPGILGTLELDGEQVRLEASPGAELRLAHEPVRSLVLRTDKQDETSLITVGPLQFHVIERQGRFGLRLSDLTRPQRVAAPEIDHFPIDPRYRVRAHLDAYDPPRTLAVPTVLGTVNQSVSPGALVFAIDDVEHRLEVIDAGERLMLVFADGTSGRETYGGGRYIYTPRPDENGFVTVDFNTAYNPPCVFTDFATCFLPPRANRLEVRLEAGEKMVEGYLDH